MKFRSRDATNNRDKIFGLLGLQDGQNAIEINPDYNAVVEKIYTRFAIRLFPSQKWLVSMHLDLKHKDFDFFTFMGPGLDI